MKKKNLLLGGLLCLSAAVFAQKQDYVWVMGRSNYPDIIGEPWGGSILDFNSAPPYNFYNWRKLNFGGCNTSICDSSGQLLLYSNGCAIAGADDEILDNGDYINPGTLHNQFCYGLYNGGYISGYQSILLLPQPRRDSVYFMFHNIIENINVPNLGLTPTPVKFLYSKIDMRLNNGKGKVLEKNKIFYNSPVSFGEMTAIKHANGTDWWIVRPRKFDGQTYLSFLFDSSGIASVPVVSTFGFNTLSYASDGQCVFTPDGRKYIRFRADEGIYIFDFDRQSGQMSNMVFVDPPVNLHNAGAGCAVSPNSRYLYLSNLDKVYQLDLEQPLDPDAFLLVAEYDGYGDPLPTNFGICQMGPDCKIYICTGNGTKIYHIIHQPDEAGMACNIEQHGLQFSAYNGASIPTFPNFRLGPPEAPGLPCTPLSVAAQSPFAAALPTISVFPNPASEYLQLAPNRPVTRALTLRIRDASGRVLATHTLPPGQETYTISLLSLPAGMYWYTLQDDTTVWRTGRLALAK
jgi:hypothetical protein